MNVAIRVDASPEIGLGHFVRCLTLADAMRKCGATVRFANCYLPEHAVHLLRERGHQFVGANTTRTGAPGNGLPHSSWLPTTQEIDAAATVEALADRRWDLVVVDHYALDFRWESVVRTVTRRILAIDDLADREHDCDILLDQNLHARMESRYAGKVPKHCRQLLGPRFALLREEFDEMRRKTGARDGRVRRVLVNFGGMDSMNFTSEAITALAKVSENSLSVDVVIGAEHPHRLEVESACSRSGFVCHVQTDRMAELMASADLAIGAGGTATWERCSLGLPALVFPVADNQRSLVDEAAVQGILYAPRTDHGIAVSIETHLPALIENDRLLRAISLEARSRVDGEGTRRVLRECDVNTVTVREATVEDSDHMLEWRNHPDVRVTSRNKEPIQELEHDAWFRSVLGDPDRILLIGVLEGDLIGVVRFDIRGGNAEVSIYLAPGRAGRGVGSDLLAAAEEYVRLKRNDVSVITAEVLGENRGSHNLFRSRGYALSTSSYRKELGTL